MAELRDTTGADPNMLIRPASDDPGPDWHSAGLACLRCDKPRAPGTVYCGPCWDHFACSRCKTYTRVSESPFCHFCLKILGLRDSDPEPQPRDLRSLLAKNAEQLTWMAQRLDKALEDIVDGAPGELIEERGKAWKAWRMAVGLADHIEKQRSAIIGCDRFLDTVLPRDDAGEGLVARVRQLAQMLRGERCKAWRAWAALHHYTEIHEEMMRRIWIALVDSAKDSADPGAQERIAAVLVALAPSQQALDEFLRLGQQARER